jgi:hypothetical protein
MTKDTELHELCGKFDELKKTKIDLDKTRRDISNKILEVATQIRQIKKPWLQYCKDYDSYALLIKDVTKTRHKGVRNGNEYQDVTITIHFVDGSNIEHEYIEAMYVSREHYNTNNYICSVKALLHKSNISVTEEAVDGVLGCVENILICYSEKDERDEEAEFECGYDIVDEEEDVKNLLEFYREDDDDDDDDVNVNVYISDYDD